MLIGQYKSKLTEKDRVSVPKKIRDELGDKLVIARWYENCLVLVSTDGWGKLIGRLSGKTKVITSPLRKIDRFVLASGFEVELDSQGRFVIPGVLKQHAAIEDEMVFLGLGDRVEVWSINSWQKMEENIQENANNAIEIIANRKEK